MAQPTEYSQRYCKSPKLTADVGLFILQAAQGTGKTKVLKDLVQPGEKVLVLSHRQFLSKSWAQRLDIPDYRDKGTNANLGTHRDSLSIVLNSLWQVTPARLKGMTVLIDEVSQVCRHLKSDTLSRGGNRRLILEAFEFLIQHAKRVYVADADIDSATLQYLKSLMGGRPVAHERNTWRPTDRNLVMVPSEAQLIDNVMVAVRSGKKVAVACDTRATAERLEAAIRGDFPHLRTCLVTAEESENEPSWVEALFTNPSAALKDVDVLVYSPTLFTSADISLKNHFEEVYLFATYNDIVVEELVQAVHRVREPVSGTVFAYVNDTRSERPVTRDSVLNLIKQKRHLPELLGVNNSGQMGFEGGSLGFKEFVLASEMRENAQRNDRRESFVQLMQSRGFTVSDADPVEPMNVTKASRKKTSLERDEEYMTLLKNEKPATAGEIKHYKQQKWLLRKQEAKRELAIYEDLNRGSEGLEALFGIEAATLKRAVTIVEGLESSPFPDEFLTAIREIEDAYPGFHSRSTINNAQIAAFADACVRNAPALQQRGLSIMEGSENRPVSLMQRYLRHFFGLEARKGEKRSTAGNRSREYTVTIQEEGQKILQRIIERRGKVAWPG